MTSHHLVDSLKLATNGRDWQSSTCREDMGTGGLMCSKRRCRRLHSVQLKLPAWPRLAEPAATCSLSSTPNKSQASLMNATLCIDIRGGMLLAWEHAAICTAAGGSYALQETSKGSSCKEAPLALCYLLFLLSP
jgi:hypothetical protein